MDVFIFNLQRYIITKLLIFNLLKEKLDVLNFMLLKGHPTKLRKNQF